MILSKSHSQNRIISMTLAGRVQSGREWERRYFAVMQGQQHIVVLRPDYTIAECIMLSQMVELKPENLEWTAFAVAQAAHAYWDSYRIPVKETKSV